MPKKTIKTYTEKNNMQRAIRKAGLHTLEYRVEQIEEMGPRQRMREVLRPVFMVASAEDVEYLEAKGWKAEVPPGRYLGMTKPGTAWTADGQSMHIGACAVYAVEPKDPT